MFFLIGNLVEALAAFLNRAYKRLLTSVNSQMIEEIVPLPEPFITVLVITFEDFDVTLASRVLISEDPELLGIGHMLLDLHAP